MDVDAFITIPTVIDLTDVVLIETYDFRIPRDGLPCMQMVRAIFQKRDRYLLMLIHLEDNTFSISEVVRRPPLEWYPISEDPYENMTEELAEQKFMEWVQR